MHSNQHSPNLPPDIFPPNFEEQLRICEENKKIPSIILTTGSFCPLHKGHIYSLLDARNFLESKFPYKVLGIYMSPSNDAYVGHKAKSHSFNKFFLNLKQRCFLIQLTLDIMIENKEIDQNFFFIDSWEGNKEVFIDFPEVWAVFNESFDRKYAGFKVFYSLGSDMIARMSIDVHKPKEMPLLVTERFLDKIEKYKKWLIDENFSEMEQNKIYYCLPSKEYGNFSSTLLRDCIEKNEKMVEELVFPEVAKQIKKFYEENNKK